jgi:hypothetical protein
VGGIQFERLDSGQEACHLVYSVLPSKVVSLKNEEEKHVCFLSLACMQANICHYLKRITSGAQFRAVFVNASFRKYSEISIVMTTFINISACPSAN